MSRRKSWKSAFAGELGTFSFPLTHNCLLQYIIAGFFRPLWLTLQEHIILLFWTVAPSPPSSWQWFFVLGFIFFFFWTKYNIEGPFQGAFDPLSPFSKGRELSS